MEEAKAPDCGLTVWIKKGPLLLHGDSAYTAEEKDTITTGGLEMLKGLQTKHGYGVVYIGMDGEEVREMAYADSPDHYVKFIWTKIQR